MRGARLAWAAAIAATGVAGGVALAALGGRGPPPVQQPMAFSHARHVAEGLDCLDCHGDAATGPHATLPLVEGCLLCHGEAVGTHPEEPRIRAFATREGAIPWIQVNRLPGHVFFSHAAHVADAGLACADCHGDVAQAAAPLSRPQIGHLSMRACEACHEAQDARLDCLACHQ